MRANTIFDKPIRESQPNPAMNPPANTNTHNPDVLSCLANLSNDEVFTPPNLANKMLDLLPPELRLAPEYNKRERADG